MSSLRTSATTALLGIAIVLLGLWVGNNVSMLPVQASSNAPFYDELFRVLFSIGTMLFVGVCGLLIYSLVRFRRRSGDMGDGSAVEDNLPLEIVWTAIPAVVVLFVGLYSYNTYERMGGMSSLGDHGSMQASAGKEERVWAGIGMASGEAATMQVDVTAMQFAFIFSYPDSSITSGELHVPMGQPVELHLKANDVIHAFWVPQFRLKQDVIPGQPTVLSFTPTKAGTYPVICAELCGPYHGGMRTSVVVQEPDAFEQWVQQNSPNPVAT
ncbi:cytochrome c oxidase subunit II [Cyanobium sp. WAJ14-Wanaka]|uniref:cytochrome c oxidase subunit II n=1 Tax=Cyanobium sp. WAJ14-Wanaka TaxID=2823725 RepID=UPI0020CE8603|nr:cytochrome c oxidase subunit II [Cyanobium sp. WAJ14-Wanaka]